VNAGKPLANTNYPALLRDELHLRNLHFASTRSLAIYLSRSDTSTGEPADLTKKRVVNYEPFANGSRHGNFLDVTYRAILAEPSWSRRLNKPHPRPECLPKIGRSWNELDSSTSSDALLMNVFCYPSALAAGVFNNKFGQPSDSKPEFGVPGNVPLLDGGVDKTEIDLRLGELFIEAKLTELDFKNKPKVKVERYRDLMDVFHCTNLPCRDQEYKSYQLIRNVLAAHANDVGSCVLIDERRPDLRALWLEVVGCIRIPKLRNRCSLRTWQQLASAAPDDLRQYLQQKYGIEAEPN
jgi:hypothetical protein